MYPEGQRRERFYALFFKYRLSKALCSRVAKRTFGSPALGLSLLWGRYRAFLEAFRLYWQQQARNLTSRMP